MKLNEPNTSTPEAPDTSRPEPRHLAGNQDRKARRAEKREGGDRADDADVEGREGHRDGDAETSGPHTRARRESIAKAKEAMRHALETVNRASTFQFKK